MIEFGIRVDEASTVQSESDGDLWPSAWADDGTMYSANGDGGGFGSTEWSDIVVNRVDGSPHTVISGERLVTGRDVSPVWGDPEEFNAKPTGMVAVDGNRDGRDELYLAVQDLRAGKSEHLFNEAPSASIVRSDDYGRTWVATDEPMFTGHVFTTIMFLDFGQSNRGAAVLGHSPHDYVYAYGLDGNWRGSYSKIVNDPTEVYLARVAADRIQDRDGWEFFAGTDSSGAPRWSREIDDRIAVLSDKRRLYVDHVEAVGNLSVIAQGGVVYLPAMDCYLYSSWTEYTFEFYRAPTPWGPWRWIHSHDFGPYPWRGPAAVDSRHGGYAATIPSKYMSDDNRELWLQSNWFWTSSPETGGRTYNFSLRRVELTPRSDAQ